MYVRNVPAPLIRRVRATAAERGESLQKFVIDAVKQRLVSLDVEVPEDDDQ